MRLSRGPYQIAAIGLLSLAVCGAAFLRSRVHAGPDLNGAQSARGYAFLNDPSDGEFVEVDLRGLNNDARELSGEFVTVTSDRLHRDGVPLGGLNGAAGDFRYEPAPPEAGRCMQSIDECSPFDLVNIYFHVDRYARDYWRDRLGVSIDFQARAVAHLPGDGAFAIPRDATIKFRLGRLFMKNAALEDEVLYHEYTHLVTWNLGFHADTDSPAETRALNEAVAHYFSASYTDDPVIGEWIATCPDRRECMGPPNAQDLLTLKTDAVTWNWNNGSPRHDLRYGACTRFHEGDGKCKTSYNHFDPQYVWSIIFGSALWDLAESIGSNLVDELLVHALRRSDGTWTFSRALDDLVAADRALHAGTHADEIREIFAARGITTVVETTTKAGRMAAEALIVSASPNPNPAGNTAEVVVEIDRPQQLSVAVYDALGRRIAVIAEGMHSAGTHMHPWSTGNIPAGYYHVVVAGGDQVASTPILLVK